MGVTRRHHVGDLCRTAMTRHVTVGGAKTNLDNKTGNILYWRVWNKYTRETTAEQQVVNHNIQWFTAAKQFISTLFFCVLFMKLTTITNIREFSCTVGQLLTRGLHLCYCSLQHDSLHDLMLHLLDQTLTHCLFTRPPGDTGVEKSRRRFN